MSILCCPVCSQTWEPGCCGQTEPITEEEYVRWRQEGEIDWEALTGIPCQGEL